jgi:hypothetical protein
MVKQLTDRNASLVSDFSFSSTSKRFIFFKQIINGNNPIIPNEQSTILHQNGMPRKCPAIIANGMIRMQAIIPNWITHLFFTGSLKGPIKRMARTKCAKASQSYHKKEKDIFRSVLYPY